MPKEDPDRHPTPHTYEAWGQASEEETSIHFKPWAADAEGYPKWSLPALEAAKCAELQGKEAFSRFHLALMAAYFERNQDISNREVLIALAHEAKLDVERFTSDLDSGSQRAKVMTEYIEALREYGDLGIPLTIFGSKYPMVGAAPVAMYRQAVTSFLNRPG